MLQNRWKSPILWLGIASIVSLVLKNVFNIVIPDYDVIVNAILALLGTLGVINNPENSTNF